MKILDFIYEIKKKIVAFYEKYFTVKGLYDCILPDKIYIKKLYKERTGRELNLKNPQTFNEKQNWLKLYDRRPEYTMMVDKYKVREYIAEKIGEEYLVPLLGVWDSPDEIDFDSLPNEFVLKCNHDNGVIICRDKSTFDIEAAKKNLAWRLKRDYYRKLREWPYKDVERKIICEKFMTASKGNKATEYKFFCYNGVPKYILIVSDRFATEKVDMDMYDIEWKHLDVIRGEHKQAGDIFVKPENYTHLCDFCRILSKDIPYVRVDFNVWNEKIHFGEMTFYDLGGFETYSPEKWNEIFAEPLVLPKEYRR